MKVRILKKLGAMALTAAVMITNIGITSTAAAGAQTAEFGQTVEAPDVGSVNAFAEDIEFENVKHNSVSGMIDYSQKGVGYSNELSYISKKLTLQCSGSSKKTLTEDELKLFYFSTDREGENKFTGLSVTGSNSTYSSGTTTITLNTTFDYSGHSFDSPTAKYQLYLCYPHINTNGDVETKVITGDDSASGQNHGILDMYLRYPPKQYELRLTSTALQSYITIKTMSFIFTTDTTLTVEDLNGETSTPFTASRSGEQSVKISFNKSNSLKDKKVTADKNYLYKIKSTTGAITEYQGTFYFTNNCSGSEAPALTPNVPGQGSTPATATCFSENFNPTSTMETPSNQASSATRYLYQIDYAKDEGKLFVKKPCTIKIEAGSNDDITSDELDNLTDDKLKLFYFGGSSGSRWETMDNSMMITGYNKTTHELSWTLDLDAIATDTYQSVVNIGSIFVNFLKKGNGATTVNASCIKTDNYVNNESGGNTVSHMIQLMNFPARWDISANTTGMIKIEGGGIGSSINNLVVLDKEGNEVSDFEDITAANDKKSVTLKIKDNSDLLKRTITSYDNAIYRIANKQSRAGYSDEYEYVTVCTFFLINDPNVSGNSGGSDNHGNGSDNPATDPVIPDIVMEGSILQLPESKTAEYSFSIDSNGKLKCGSEEVKKDDDPDNALTLSGASDYSKVKWVLETPDTYPKVSGKAKFKNANGKAVASVTGDKAALIMATASKKFNSIVVLKLVSEDYKAATSKKAQVGTVYARKVIFITPAVPTTWTDVSSKLSKAGLTAAANESGYEQVYTMSIAENKSVKLPFAPKDGADRSMVYEIGENSSGFSVVSGTVKALTSGGSGSIICYPKYAPAKKILINVVTTAAVKSLRANTTKVTVYSNSSQTIYLGTVPPSMGTEFLIGGKNSGTFTGGSWSISGNALTITGDSSVTKSTKHTLEVSAAGKSLKIAISGASAPQNAKNFKLTTKKLNADGFIEVNIPVGSAVNLGVCMNPVTADADFTWKYSTSADAVLTSEKNAVINAEQDDISGDVIKGNKSCTYYMQAESEAVDSDGEPVRTPIYKINVYEPGATIVMNPLPESPIAGAEEFTVVGGVLMSRSEADTTCCKNLTGGKAYIFPIPSTAGAVKEDIIWSCNKPAAVGIDTVTNPEYMTITPMQTGSFTITGKTKFTKQNLSFKVNVVSEDSSVASANENDFVMQYLDSDGTWKNFDSNPAINVKEKMNVRVLSTRTGAVGTVKFTADGSVCSVNASGVVTAKTAGTGKVKATVNLVKSTDKKNPIIKNVAEASFTVNGTQLEYKSVSVPLGVVKGKQAQFTATVKNVKPADIKSIKWEYANTPDATDWTAISGATALKGKFTVDISAGTYYVRCNADGVTSEAKPITVYAADQNIKSASFKCTVGDKGVVASYNKMVSDLNGSREGAGATYGYYYLLVFATPNDSSQELTAAGTDDIVWTSSNVNLATAETVSRWSYDGNQGSVDSSLKKSAYAIVRIDTSVAQANKYTGKVTITGILKNSGKKISVTLNLRKGAGSNPTDYYHPGDDIPSFGPITANIDLDIDVGSFKYLLDQTEAEAYGEGSQKEYRYSHKWALSKVTNPSRDDDVVFLEGDELKGIGDTGSCNGKLTLNIPQEIIDKLKSLESHEANKGLCYLVEVYKVRRSHTDGSGTTWENDDHFHSVVCGSPFIISEKSPSND